MIDSTFNGNKANGVSGDGGGISNIGTLIVTNTTFTNNMATDKDGGIRASDGSTLILTNVTMNVNEASDGDGGGLYNNTLATISLINTIVANSVSGGDCSGIITSLGNNLDSDNTCGLASPGELSGMVPLLGLLQDNGGPSFTHALHLGSPAIDTGDNTVCPAADQRGVSRPLDGDGDLSAICDIWAYEAGFNLAALAPGDAGVENTLSAAGAPPGQNITFVFGINPDPDTGIPGCPGVFVDMDSPQLLGSAMADATGNVSLTFLVPGSATGSTIRLQAVAQASCHVSNVVVHTFP